MSRDAAQDRLLLSRSFCNSLRWRSRICSLENRRRLVASVSHELRTPLATLRGYLEPALENQAPPSPDDLIIIQSKVQHLERLIEDLFTLSQAEGEQLTLQTEPTEIQPLAQRLVLAIGMSGDWRDKT